MRFDRGDIKALEDVLGIGYPHFNDRGIFGSLVATEMFAWRGLKEETSDGKIVHVFPLNDAGKEEAGELVFSYLRGDGPSLNDAIARAFIACGLWKTGSPEEKKTVPGEDAPKNLQT
jgi:hypothetical protein